MKKYNILTTIVIIFCASILTFAQNVGINTDGSIPTMMLDVKTSPSALSDGIRINNPNTGNGDAVLNFQNNGVDVWTLGFDDSDADKFKIGFGSNLVSTNTMMTVETDGQVGINTTVPNTRLHVNGAAAEDVFRLQTSGTTKMFMQSDGNVAIGGFFAPDDQLDVRGNVQIDQGYLRVGAPAATTIRKYGVQAVTWNGLVTAANNQPNFVFQNVGNFTIPNGIPAGTVIRVDKIMWEVDAFHEDGNEDKQIEVRIGASAWYGYFENSSDGALPIDWHFIRDFGTGGYTFTNNQVVQMRVMDDDCCWNDRFYVYNMHVKVFYSYDIPLQAGDISSSGRIYANSNQAVGDLAEYFESDIWEPGTIISLKNNEENSYSATSRDYEPNIVGVISENPSVVLNSPQIGPPVALAGRVNVKVRADQKPIKSGEFLTSSIGGYAIRATKPGPTIGFAVTNQKEGENFVEILVQPGRFYMPENYSIDAINNFVEENNTQTTIIDSKTKNIQVKQDDDNDENDLNLSPGKYETINGIPVRMVSESEK